MNMIQDKKMRLAYSTKSVSPTKFEARLIQNVDGKVRAVFALLVNILEENRDKFLSYQEIESELRKHFNPSSALNAKDLEKELNALAQENFLDVE